ncbi:MAG TPA: hypothetical protein VF867_18675 [Arthrobacter sp.]
MIPAPIPLAPLIIILIVLCAAFGWAAAKSGIDAARGKLAGELVLWTFNPGEAPPVSGDTAGDTGTATDAGPRRLEIPWKALGFSVAAISGALAVLCGAVLMGPVANYQHSYERTVWSALNDSYGIHAAIPDQGFQSGISFPALLAGKTVECAATPPAMVICDGTALDPKK